MNKELYFEDLSTFWKYAMEDSCARQKHSRSNDNLQWTGGLTWEQAKRMAQMGWADGMKEIEKYRAYILPVIAEKVLRPLPTQSMVGYFVDVGRFLANEPECFVSRAYEEKNYSGRVYKMVCSISFSSAISSETIIQRGAMVCALIDAIEYAGNRVEVIANQSTCKGGYKEQGWFEVSVTVKKSTQPLEMTDLAFCLAHPAMLRRMMFSVAELNGWSDFTQGNYGVPAEATDKGDIYIKEIYSKNIPDNQAIEWVLSELEKLGIRLESNT